MTLYALQKAIYEINRSDAALQRYRTNPQGFAEQYALNPEESGALTAPDIGLLYVLGVNGQLLMHLAAVCGYAWDAYIAAMRTGLTQHGPVRDGLYAVKGASR
jgi:hypothetical protein